ncbi:MAG: LacI family DNA-binding transcriptional regulator [Chloroflexi bacterium]|nr:LacI family DNA-binding transcriptional regulator [Chloroflexota bacterium]
MDASARAKRGTTIKDVADAAGVSVGTVSHVVSGARQVRPATRDRVNAAIAELGFRPNRVARSLTRSRTSTVGMVIPDVANPFFAQLIRGASDALEASDYVVVFGNSDNLATKERRYLVEFIERRVDGMIIAPAANADADQIRDLGEQLPVVLVDRVTPGWLGDLVVGDDQAGMALAVDHLIGQGHRRIALINGEEELSTARARRLGFEQALRARDVAAVAVSDGAFSIESGREQAMAMLAADPRPTAICAGNDLLALGGLQAAHELGFSVPGQLSVMGYDDIAYAKLASPRLTSVSQPGYAIGAAAARLLIERLRDPSGARQEVAIRPSLILRESTAPPARPSAVSLGQ